MIGGDEAPGRFCGSVSPFGRGPASVYGWDGGSSAARAIVGSPHAPRTRASATNTLRQLDSRRSRNPAHREAGIVTQPDRRQKSMACSVTLPGVIGTTYGPGSSRLAPHAAGPPARVWPYLGREQRIKPLARPSSIDCRQPKIQHFRHHAELPYRPNCLARPIGAKADFLAAPNVRRRVAARPRGQSRACFRLFFQACAGAWQGVTVLRVVARTKVSDWNRSSQSARRTMPIG